MKRHKKKAIYGTRHHVLPTSRDGTNHGSNIIIVPQNKHDAYHLLFQNKTPEEVIKCLLKDWGFRQYFKQKGGS